MKFHFLFILLLLSCNNSLQDFVPCYLKDFGDSSFVCVCNNTYCDTVADNIKQGHANIYSSTKLGQRLDLTYEQFLSFPTAKSTYVINKNVTYQEIIGFGGAFTDAAGINIDKLSQGAQTNLLKSYYSPSGIEYSLGRVPMASCDFSTHPYSYDDIKGDFNLTKFSLTSEDIKYKIKYIQIANAMSRHNLTMFGSPWSAPAWMKTNQNMTGKGTLIGQPGGQYFKTWAMYFVKFIQEYSKHGIKFWGITGQNEPTDGNIQNFPFQAMGWTPDLQKDFIAKDLGPALEQNGLAHVKIMILDDSRLLLPYWAEKVFASDVARKYVSGIAVHWYEDKLVPANALSITHDLFPEKFILGTEACTGELGPLDPVKVRLGNWERAESYAHDIMQDLQHWVAGWTDWNIALDMQGGPNWVKNFVDSPIIVNADKDEFYKQPMYYILGHFSKFLVPGSKRLDLTVTGLKNKNAEVVAFLRPDSSIVAILLNRFDDEILVSLKDPDLGYINIDMIPHSIQTVTWWPPKGSL